VTGLIEKLSNAWSPVHREGREGLPGSGVGRGLNLLRGSRTEQLNTMCSVGTVFGIVDRIASSQSSVEWCLYRKARSGKKEDRTEVTNHLALDLWNKPNGVHTGPFLREAGQQHYELTGEGWIVVELAEGFKDLPLSMWIVRPDRIEPIPGTDTFLAGYVYTSVDGEKVPLKVNEVLSIKRPNPLDPYRGLGAISSVLLETQSARAAAEWNRNFFRNGAMPGGVIEVPNELGDDQFTTLITRWRESHKGVSRAHRVGVLEHGAKFTPVTYSIKDMQMTEVRGMTRDSVMEAFGISRHMLGITEDVNRASAAAGEYMFSKYIDLPRARRWREMANHFYLPLFGATARDLEFDFENLVPEDAEAENAARNSKATAAKAYKDAGYPMAWICETLELSQIPDTSNADALSPMDQALLAQKLYLAVGELGDAGIILTPPEARAFLAKHGFDIDASAIIPTKDDPRPALPAPPITQGDL
jgi:HK97 family phage portal protein